MRTTVWITGILAITAGLVMAGSCPCFAIDTPDTGYKITSTNKTIDVFGTCKQVSSSRSLFAPTKSSDEWSKFLNWDNSILRLDPCETCSDGIQNQGETGIDCGGPNCPACPACIQASDCNDSNPCTNDTCAGGTCQHANNTASCDDSNAETCNDACSGGTCSGVACVSCAQDSDCNDSNPCTNDTCAGGTCQHANNTDSCDDSNPTTCNDACSNGTCSGGICGCLSDGGCSVSTPECGTVYGVDNCNNACERSPEIIPAGGPCDDSNSCTDDSCVSNFCTHTNNTASCDDGDAATCNDACSGGSCAGGACGASCGDGTCGTGENCSNCPADCGCPTFQYCNSGPAGDNLCYCDASAVCINMGYTTSCGSAGCGDADVSPWGGNWSTKCDGLTFGCVGGSGAACSYDCGWNQGQPGGKCGSYTGTGSGGAPCTKQCGTGTGSGCILSGTADNNDPNDITCDSGICTWHCQDKCTQDSDCPDTGCSAANCGTTGSVNCCAGDPVRKCGNFDADPCKECGTITCFDLVGTASYCSAG